MRHIRPLPTDAELAGELPDEDARLVLAPGFMVRRESHFVSLWRVGDDANVYDFDRLHPTTAIMLALFDGTRTVRRVAQDYARAAGVAERDVRRALASWLRTRHDRLVAVDLVARGEVRRYDPRSFVMPAENVAPECSRPDAPLALYWMVTNACPADCLYCFAERNPVAGPPLGLSRMRQLVNEIAELQIGSVLLTGGDPFLYPHILELVEALCSSGVLTRVSTKCELPEKTIDRLVGAGLSKLQVSIDTLDEPTHCMLTRAPGLLGRTVATARRAIAAGMEVTVNAVVTPHNLSQLEQLSEAMIAFGVQAVHLSAYTRSIYRPREDLLLSREEVRCAEELADSLQCRYPSVGISLIQEAALPFGERALCTAGITQLSIHQDGKAVLCCQAPSVGPSVVGDLSQDSIKTVWHSDRVSAMRYPDRTRFHGTACEDCDDFDVCHQGRGRCFMASLKAYGTLFGPVPECPRAPRPEVVLRSGEIVAAVRP